jgi:hypothetical protein
MEGEPDGRRRANRRFRPELPPSLLAVARVRIASRFIRWRTHDLGGLSLVLGVLGGTRIRVLVILPLSSFAGPS